MTLLGSPRRSPPPRMPVRQDFGDWQTPRGLVVAVLARLRADGSRFERVLEPTCGQGHFLEEFGPELDLIGIEIQADHAETARTRLGGRAKILTADLFRLDLASDLPWRGGGRLLVVGNPPWVTVAALGKSGGAQHNPGPERINLSRTRGLDALTGSSNFDLAEAVWLKLIRELACQEPTIALLCKASVARALLRSVETANLPIRAANFWKIDAAHWFGTSVGAGLLRIEVGANSQTSKLAVFGSLEAEEPTTTWGLADGSILADLAAYDRARCADGSSPIVWRQGVKHDVARVVELIPELGGVCRNGLGELVDVEPERIYPWFKATDLARGTSPEPRRVVVITQETLGDDPRDLARTHPRLWAYLRDHADHFNRRQSAIYRNRPPFALFGIGPYTFSPYKVAISGLHKTYRFRALGPVGGRPPLVDDTSYFLPCPTAEAACTLAAVLNGPDAANLLRGLTFLDAKRPITQTVLKRLDLQALLAHAEVDSLRQRVVAEWHGLADPERHDPATWRLGWQEEWARLA